MANPTAFPTDPVDGAPFERELFDADGAIYMGSRRDPAGCTVGHDLPFAAPFTVRGTAVSMSAHNPIYHLKDAYYFEVPKALWRQNWQSLDDVPQFLRDGRPDPPLSGRPAPSSRPYATYSSLREIQAHRPAPTGSVIDIFV